MSGWEVCDDAAVNVVPIDDAVSHNLDMDCVCGPSVEFTDGRPLVTHHSLDGREAREDAGDE